MRDRRTVLQAQAEQPAELEPRLKLPGTHWSQLMPVVAPRHTHWPVGPQGSVVLPRGSQPQGVHVRLRQ